MTGTFEVMLAERPDEHESVERLCALARAYTVTLGWDDVFRVQGRVQGSQTRELQWTPADGARALHTMLADYREYLEGVWFPRVDGGLLGGVEPEETTIYAHGVGLRLLSVRGDRRVAERLQQLAAEVEAGAEPAADATSPDPRQRRMALFAMTWPTARGERDNASLAADIKTRLRQALDDEAPSVRATAAAIAGRYRILALFDDVAARTADGSAAVRAAALTALRGMDEVGAIAVAAAALSDDDSHVRRAALAVVRHLGHLPWSRRKEIAGDAAARLCAAWPHLEAAERLQAVEWLVGCPQPEARAAVVALRADPDPRVRRKAAEVLGTLERDDTLADLVGFLDDAEEEVQVAALEALSRDEHRARLQGDAALLAVVMRRLERLAVPGDG